MQDFERSLTAKGRKQFRSVAEWLVEHGQVPRLILTSPLNRALETAEILASAANIGKEDIEVEQQLSPGLDPVRLVNLLDSLDESPIAIVGHEPDLSHFTSELIGGGHLNLCKGAVACLEFDEQVGLGEGRLRWLITPKLLQTP